MNFFEINKTLICNNGDSLCISFIPNENYKAQTATNKSEGSLAFYIENMFMKDVLTSTMLKICDEISILDFDNFKHCWFVIEGLLKIITQKR